MPTVNVKRDSLFSALGRIFSEQEFDDLCFSFGIELDEVTSEKQIVAREQGLERSSNCSDDVVYKIEVPANRYDLLCLEGLTLGLQVFQGVRQLPVFRAFKPAMVQRAFVKKEVQQVRPYFVAAILRNMNFTKERYNSFLDLQDKLHQNIGRKRTLVAIGTHDLDTIVGPFTYSAAPPSEIKFKPLNKTKEFTAVEMMEIFKTESHLRQYIPIIQHESVYPILYDSRGVVLSMPPIINGDHSKITLDTRNVFIDVTATDLNKAKIALNTLVTAFGTYCDPPHLVEVVEVVDHEEKVHSFPELLYRKEVVSASYLNRSIGINESALNYVGLLNRMSYSAELVEDSDQIQVTIPPTRADVLHVCDIMEDAAIAYGYDNIPKEVPKTMTVAEQVPLNRLSEALRMEVAMSGYIEALNFVVCSGEDMIGRMKDPVAAGQIVRIANNTELNAVRTSLIPGMMKTIASNKGSPLPLKLFELADVVIKDPTKDVQARNERRLCAINYNKTPGFEIVHGLLDRIMMLVEKKPVGNDPSQGYRLQPVEDSRFFPGRSASVILNDVPIGVIGVIHPDVLTNFDISNPCAVLEISVEPFL